MANAALYFPYIDVPPTQWLFRALLYWDTVKSIVPLDYLHKPELHSRAMRELLAAELVEPVVPAMHIGEIERFGSAFLAYIDRCLRAPPFFTPAGRDMEAEDYVNVHVEKLGHVSDALVARGLAVREGYAWFRMRAWVARAFMAYLAGVLSRQPTNDADPLTSDRRSFALLSGSRNSLVNERRSRARSALIRAILPTPMATLHLDSVARFKEKYSEALRRFRTAVELGCIDIAQIEDHTLRQERTRLIAGKLQDEIGNIREAMRLQWGQVMLGSLAAVLGAGLGLALENQALAQVSASSALAATVYQSFDPLRARRNALSAPLAYGALSWREFAGT